jgi:hypothetical protein
VHFKYEVFEASLPFRMFRNQSYPIVAYGGGIEGGGEFNFDPYPLNLKRISNYTRASNFSGERVSLVVKTLGYKPEGRGFEAR